jgi:type VI secretion system Hcp family effector
MADEVFAQYDGIEGESKNPAHRNWIEVLGVWWSSKKPVGEPRGSSSPRRREGVVSEIVLTFGYEKSTPKLLTKFNMGEMIPRLVIEHTANRGNDRVTYLKYELERVTITSLEVSASDEDESRPTVSIGNKCEKYKVTYSEYDSQGRAKGEVEAAWSVAGGR